LHSTALFKKPLKALLKEEAGAKSKSNEIIPLLSILDKQPKRGQDQGDELALICSQFFLAIEFKKRGTSISK
jgi:hypothetical protein